MSEVKVTLSTEVTIQGDHVFYLVREAGGTHWEIRLRPMAFDGRALLALGRLIDAAKEYIEEGNYE